VEARVGWDKTTLGASYDDGVDRLSEDGHDTSLILGGELGYDTALGKTVIAGAYAGVEFADGKDCSPVIGNDSACLKLGRNLTVGGRLGAKVAPLAMIYVKGGFSDGQLRETYTNLDDPTLDFSDHTNRGGFHFGAGGEFNVSSTGYVRVEYVRTNYHDYTYSDPDFSVKIDGHRDQVVAGFGLRF
jgi:outer membrane immunogenic protein